MRIYSLYLKITFLAQRSMPVPVSLDKVRIKALVATMCGGSFYRHALQTVFRLITQYSLLVRERAKLWIAMIQNGSIVEQ